MTTRCPACGDLLDGPLDGYTLLREETPGGDRHAIKVLVFACRNCGYLRLHSSNVVREITGLA